MEQKIFCIIPIDFGVDFEWVIGKWRWTPSLCVTSSSLSHCAVQG